MSLPRRLVAVLANLARLVAFAGVLPEGDRPRDDLRFLGWTEPCFPPPPTM